MTIAVDWDIKQQTKTKQNLHLALRQKSSIYRYDFHYDQHIDLDQVLGLNSRCPSP